VGAREAATVVVETRSESTAESARCATRGLPDLTWVRANAENLLFLEHLQKQAAEQNLYGWRSQLTSAEYQARLDQINTGEECEEVSLADRVAMLEERLVTCGGATGKLL